MKFKSIKLHNFMRYKGDNELKFSCDKDKNVTIILGDNSNGKTTIAQAFRWGLYGDIIDTNYGKKNDAVLLNNEVIAGLDVNGTGVVRVEIVVEGDGRIYEFIRSKQFRKKTNDPNDLTIIPIGGDTTSLSMRITENGERSDVISNLGNKSKEYPAGCVQEAIDSMFPPSLSNYFFFDGERWNNLKNKTKDIEDSIYTILGVKSLIKMREHLTEGNNSYKTTVEKQLKRAVQGSSSESESLQREIRQLENRMDTFEEEIESHKKTIEETEAIIEQCDRELEAHRNIEHYQIREKEIENQIKQDQSLQDRFYSNTVKKFSQADKCIAAGMIDRIKETLNNVDLEGKDIPGVTQDTIDFLLKMGTCICGEPLTPEHAGYKRILALREEVYPKKIGGPAKAMLAYLDTWKEQAPGLKEEIRSNASDYERLEEIIERNEIELSRIREKIDRRVDLSSIRSTKTRAQTEKKEADTAISRLKINIENTKSEIERKNRQVRLLTEQDKANRFIYICVDYVRYLSDIAEKLLARNKGPILQELNELIGENFSKMFNEKDKYAKLKSDYRIHMYYKDVGGRGDYEEENLSMGEMIAVNFVFIVSVLELARKRREARSNGNDILSLPLVLDAPFSNLSGDNTGLVASKLPEFAEQVIIFMLDKDWEASGLSDSTLSEYCYRISKEVTSNSSSISQGRF